MQRWCQDDVLSRFQTQQQTSQRKRSAHKKNWKRIAPSLSSNKFFTLPIVEKLERT
jgi:hypothetical protein